jgi:hypothetical protein
LLQPEVTAAFESEDIVGIMTPVMVIMPELQELCGESAPPLSMEHVDVKSLGSETMAPTPPPLVPSPPDLVDADAFFVKELCDLLASLEVASPGSSKDIVCLLAGPTTGTKSTG